MMTLARWLEREVLRWEYRTYMRSDAWAQKRWQVLARAHYRCEQCGARHVRLEVHHLTYRHFKSEPLEELMALCWDCHRAAHRK